MQHAVVEADGHLARRDPGLPHPDPDAGSDQVDERSTSPLDVGRTNLIPTKKYIATKKIPMATVSMSFPDLSRRDVTPTLL